MKINIAQIKKIRGESLAIAFEIPASDLLQGDFSGDFASDVSVTGTVTNVGTGMLVKGTLSTVVRDKCARCLESIESDIVTDFAEEFFSRKDLMDVKDFYTYDGDFIDIKDYMAEILSIEKPLKSLCDESCRGLCPVCGINLNNETCACEKSVIDPRLAELKKYIQ